MGSRLRSRLVCCYESQRLIVCGFRARSQRRDSRRYLIHGKACLCRQRADILHDSHCAGGQRGEKVGVVL